jgi:predicted nucleotidyltransferase
VKEELLVPEVISLEEVKARFGTGTPRRQFLFDRLQSVFTLLHETMKVKHVYLFGSFPTEISFPNDVDLFVVMREGFTTIELKEKLLSVFTYDICRIRYNIDLFLVTEAVGEEQIKETLDVFSRNRMQQSQQILEVMQ